MVCSSRDGKMLGRKRRSSLHLSEAWELCACLRRHGETGLYSPNSYPGRSEWRRLSRRWLPPPNLEGPFKARDKRVPATCDQCAREGNKRSLALGASSAWSDVPQQCSGTSAVSLYGHSFRDHSNVAAALLRPHRLAQVRRLELKCISRSKVTRQVRMQMPQGRQSLLPFQTGAPLPDALLAEVLLL